MGNRRLGAQRLNALLKRGSNETDTLYQAGAGMKNAIVSHKLIKNGGIIETQILVDLQGTNGAQIFSGDTDLDLIGESTAEDGTGAVADCSLMTWENDVHGVYFEADIQIVEVPAGGSLDLTIGFDPFSASSAQATALPGGSMSLLLLDQTNNVTAGDRHILPDPAGSASTPIAAQTDIDTLGLYIAAADGAPGAAYTAGKILITLRGYDNQWGF